ncbi:MAG: SAM-dependent methyltransferase [Deltaproteobacteria bacterium]|nr:SAM-dependent methyltransferase [Deltaproteobacteria bacterium]
MSSNSGSFRDPFGKVFTSDGKVFRSIFSPGVKTYEAAKMRGVYEHLIDKRLLISHEETQVDESAAEGAVYCLAHPCLPMVSYPWEWSFSMLKDAALLHLEAMEILVPRGFWLRDASAFNVQYDGKQLVLIDTLSIGKRTPDSPWVAYGQFCAHFLAPLAIAAYCDIRLLSLWRSYIEGFPLDLVVKMLPSIKKYRPGIFMHLKLHSAAQASADKKEDITKIRSSEKIKVGDKGLIGIVSSLKRTIDRTNWKRRSAIWEDYGEIRTYDDPDVAMKSEYVENVIRQLKPKMVWDLGANRGEFSLIAASHGAFVVSIDGDPACSEALYEKIGGEKRITGILPLTMDLANPSPGLGWNSKERLSLSERGPADLVMALALIHHLVLSSCVPFDLIAEWFSTLGNSLLIEFVPPDDPMVKKLLQNRGDEHLPYSLNLFKRSFASFYDFEEEIILNNGRILFLCERSKNKI